MTRTIGITGCTGSGKTTAVRELARLGLTVINADVIAREALTPNSVLVPLIVEEFGREVLLVRDVINRRALSQIVFSDPEKLQRLNAIMHPFIKAEMLTRARDAIRIHNKPFVVFDAPLLIEAGMKDDVDDIWLITAPYEQRVKRLMARDNADREDILKRISSRMSDEELAAYADVVIDNSGSVRELIQKIDNIFKERVLKR